MLRASYAEKENGRAALFHHLQALQQTRAAFLPKPSAVGKAGVRACGEALLAEARMLADGGDGGWHGAASEMAAAASALDVARKGINHLVAAGTNPDVKPLTQAIEERSRAAHHLRATAMQVLQQLPSAEKRAQQQTLLQLVPNRIRQLLAQLPAPECMVEKVKDPARCELPALAEGAGSATAALQVPVITALTLITLITL